MARKDFVIVDQLSELLRAHVQPKRCQDSDRSRFLGFRRHSESPAFKYVLVGRNFAVFGVCGVEAVAAKVGVS